MLRTNAEKLVKTLVLGEVASPVIGKSIYSVSPQATPTILPGVGGITSNIRVGGLACGWEADHVEPCVSLEKKKTTRDMGREPTPRSM